MKRRTKEKKITQSALARSLGVSRQLIAHHRRTGKAPPLSDEAAWIEYLAANGREGSMPTELRRKVARERLRLIRAQAERVEMENREKRKETVAFAAVQRFLSVLAELYFGELDRLVQEFPVSLKGKTEAEIDGECRRQAGEVKKSIRAGIENWMAGHQPQAEQQQA